MMESYPVSRRCRVYGWMICIDGDTNGTDEWINGKANGIFVGLLTESFCRRSVIAMTRFGDVIDGSQGWRVLGGRYVIMISGQKTRP